MSGKSKRPRVTGGPVAAIEQPARRKRGRPRKTPLAAPEAPVTAAKTVRRSKIAMPRSGPGRRKMVPRDSLDGIAADLAIELAESAVSKLRDVVDRLVRIRLATMLERLK